MKAPRSHERIGRRRRPRSPIMNACPDEDELLRFLNGEPCVQDAPRIVAHVEHCAACQERLERLTCGPPARETRCRSRRCASVLRRLSLFPRQRPTSRSFARDPRATAGRRKSERIRSRTSPPAGMETRRRTAVTWRIRPERSPPRTRALTTRHSRGRIRAPTRWIGTLVRLAAIAGPRARPSGRWSRGTRSSSGWAKVGWGSSTRRGTWG